MAIWRNLLANIVSEIGIKVQSATHEEWWQNLRNGLFEINITNGEWTRFRVLQ